MSAATRHRPPQGVEDWRREAARSAAVSAARRRAARRRKPTMVELSLAVVAGSGFGTLVVLVLDRAV